VSVSRSFELINPPAINILAVFLRYFPAFEEGGGVPELYSVCAGDSGNSFRVEKTAGKRVAGSFNMRGVTVTTQKRSIVFGGCTVWLLTRILTKLIIKKVPIMKRLFFLIAIAFLMAGCSDKDDENVDMASVGHYVWQNESDHRITLTVIGRFENEVLLPKERISKTMIGFIFPPSPRSYTIEGMKISFDDGSYGGVFSIPTEYPTAPYNPCDEYNYEMGEEYKESGMLQRQWTYTFTNADYDAAVARGPMTEQ